MTNEERDKLEAQIRQLTTERNALRQEVIYYTSSSRVGQVAALRAENERLTAELADVRMGVGVPWYSELLAERDRLREQIELAMAEAQDARERWIPECDRLRAALALLIKDRDRAMESSEATWDHAREALAGGKATAPHCADHKEFDPDCQDCSDVLADRKNK